MAPLRHDQFIKELIKLSRIYPEYATILQQLIVQLQQRHIDMGQEREYW